MALSNCVKPIAFVFPFFFTGLAFDQIASLSAQVKCVKVSIVYFTQKTNALAVFPIFGRYGKRLG